MPLTFCVIDDEREICDLFQVLFESRGHHCVSAHNGPDGLALVQSRLPAAVFLDVQMPKMNGLEVLARLKQNASTAAIPVLLMSGLMKEGSGQTDDWLKSTGANACICKPFSVEDLLDAVASVTGMAV
jgi:CheY-like chemotaxis protein